MGRENAHPSLIRIDLVGIPQGGLKSGFKGTGRDSLWKNCETKYGILEASAPVSASSFRAVKHDTILSVLAYISSDPLG